MYENGTGGQLAGTGIVVTIGGHQLGMPVVVSIVVLLLLAGAGLFVAGRRVWRGRRNG